MATIVIRLNGTDITNDVIFADARFISQANGQPGQCSFRIRDLEHTYHNLQIGSHITLDIDGQRAWGGFVMQTNRGYFFEARDCRCPPTVPLYYRVVGSDYNVLLNRRVIFDLDTPENQLLQSFAAGTADETVIEYYTANYLDLTGDSLDTTTLVEHVGTPSLDEAISSGAGITWNQFMMFVAYNTGSIWYIDPDRKLVYTDVDTPNAPFDISDNPGPGQIGAREMTVQFDGTRLINDALVWGAGKGSAELVLGRATDAASIAEHGLWQVGRVVGGAWKQETVDRTAATYVDGSPQSQRGGKIDRHSVECVVFEPGLRVAQKVHVYSDVFDFDEVIPIRVLSMTFPTTDSVQYQITLAHEIDEPQHLVDPRPRTDRDRLCSTIHCGTLGTGDGIDTTIAVSSSTQNNNLTGNQAPTEGGLGNNDWNVYIQAGVNYWQWTTNDDFVSCGTNQPTHRVHLQYADLYSYTTLPGQLIAEGPAGWEFRQDYDSLRVPSSTWIPDRVIDTW